MRYFFVALALLINTISAGAFQNAPKPRIAVIPFQNTDGKMENHILCYQYQEETWKALNALDPNSEHYQLVPADSIDALLAQMNIDPRNPQYLSDLWKSIKLMNVQFVVSGNFNIQSDKILVNAYVFNARTKLPNRQYQAIDIFKDKTKPMEAVPEVIEALKPALIPEK